MLDFNVIELDNPKWDEIVKSSRIYDFHHTAFYHSIDNNYQSVLFVASNEDDFIGLPLVIRPIDDSPWFDATSVYGYGGPIASQQVDDLPLDLLMFFKTSLQEYFVAKNVISVFSRLHPLISYGSMFDGLGDVVDLNKTVAIDLMLTPEEQRRQYRKSNKSEINQLRKKGFVVEVAVLQNDIDRFADIYYETMDRVKASPYYYFTQDYFRSFLSNSSFENKLLVAKFDGEIVAGAIFTITDKIMQYHLAGTTEEFIRLTPMKLILDEARLIGNALTPAFLHLGGGVGGSDDDSLFRFKSGFSNHYCQFSVWKYIVDQEKYKWLVKENGLSTHTESSFFPLYRQTN